MELRHMKNILLLGEGPLYQVHKQRSYLEYQAARQKALWLIMGIGLCIGVAVALWLKP